MIYDLSDELNTEGKTIEDEVECGFSSFEIEGETYEIQSKSKISIAATNKGTDKCLLHISYEFSFIIPCSRCLTDVNINIPVAMEYEIVRGDASSESDNQLVIDGYSVEIDDLVHDGLVLNWPTKVLCKPDCKGICMQCGKDLNHGDCGCDTFVPDPRMAAIKDIFEANKEV